MSQPEVSKDARSIPRFLRLYKLEQAGLPSALVLVADADMLYGTLIAGAAPFAALATWMPDEKAWRWVSYTSGQIARLTPTPRGNIPNPPVSLAGWVNGKGDDSVVIDLDRPAILRAGNA